VNAEATVFETLQRTAEKEVGACWSWRARHVISERDYARNIVLLGRAPPNTRSRNPSERFTIFTPTRKSSAAIAWAKS